MSVKISKKYGVNPSVDTCYICGKEYGVVLFGTSYKDKNGKTAEAPRTVCTGNICPDCQKIIDDGGVFIIETEDKTDKKNPYRTGRLVAIKKESAERIFQEGSYKSINYMEHSTFETIFGNVLKEMNS